MKTFITVISFILFFYLWGATGQLIFSPHVSQHIEETSHYPNEIMACLEYVDIGKIIIYDYYTPTITKSTPSGVNSEGCNESIPYHNHPYHYIHTDRSLNKYYTKATGQQLTSKDQMLYVSITDMMAILSSQYKYAVVASNGSYSWWTREEIKESFISGQTLLKPVR